MSPRSYNAWEDSGGAPQGPPPIDPSSIANFYWWYHAADITLDGGGVPTQWGARYSLNSGQTLAAAGTVGPSWSASAGALNKPAAFFNTHTSARFAYATPPGAAAQGIDGAQAYTSFTVADWVGGAPFLNGHACLVGLDNGGVNQWALLAGVLNSGSVQRAYIWRATANSVANWTENTGGTDLTWPALIVHRWTSTSIECWSNGTQVMTAQANTRAPICTTQAIGNCRLQNIWIRAFPGWIYENLTYNRALSIAEMDELRTDYFKRAYPLLP